MLWKGRRESDNVEDHRGGGGGGKLIGGGIGAIIIAVIVYFLGGDPQQVLQQVNSMQPQTQSSQPYQGTAEEEEAKHFVKTILAETEDVWGKIFADMGETYTEPNLVLFSGADQSGCGGASSAMGPFYCPEDSKVYIDLSFYDELKNRFHAPGDFTMAYVVAHEVGHHVQHLMGISEKVHQMRSRLSEAEYNKLSVKLELQADFFAGVWAHYTATKGIVEPGDIDEALNAANQIGDDRLQQRSQGRIVPDAFTHGTSEQRMRWFKKGFETGDIKQGDTFNATEL
ncbi:MAG: neutral zinc metallopeptidase [Bacteroidetes bacterium]|nr:neutral zinc metallopeptidase [Bacteroidota bacterium]